MASLAVLRLRNLRHHGRLAAAAATLMTTAAAVVTSCEESGPTQPQRSSNVKRTTLRRRMTPVGHFSVLSETKDHPSICTFFVTLRGPSGSAPMTPDRLAQLWEDRHMNLLHPRFHQTACTTWPGYFREEEPDAPQHISETLLPQTGMVREDLRQRLVHLQTSPMDLSQSLWHAWVGLRPLPTVSYDTMGTDTTSPVPEESLVLVRSHHVLADGASMGAALMDLFDEAPAMREEIQAFFRDRRRHHQAKSLLDRIQRYCQRVYWFLAASCQALLYQCYCLAANAWNGWIGQDPWRMLENAAPRHGDTHRRTVAWAGPVASVEQAKWIAHTLGGPQCTLNDVFVSCVTAALARLLEQHRQHWKEVKGLMPALLESNNKMEESQLPQQSHMNVTVPVHLKGGIIMPGESVGNSLGAFVARIPSEGAVDSESRLRAVHKELHFLKQTPAALLSHILATTLSYAAYILPPTLTSWLFRQASAGSLAVITNVRMSPTRNHIDGHEVTQAYGFVPLPPGLPIGVVVASYDGNMYLSVTAEQWAVPDGDEFLCLVLDEYLNLLGRARQKLP